MNALYLNEGAPRLDRLQIAAVAGLMCLSVAFILSATMVSGSAASLSLVKQLWFRQLIWYGVGLTAAVGVCFVDYHTLVRWSFVAYWVTILALIAVLIPGIGSTQGWGARRWIDLGVFSLQPSEFAKLGFILALASFLSRPTDELRLGINFWKPIGMLLLPFLLIIKEPDLGSALVLVPTGFTMMYVAGTPRKYLLRLLGLGGVVAVLFVADVLFVTDARWRIPLHSYQRDRLLVYFGRDYTDFAPPNATKEVLQRLGDKQRDDSLNVRQALISVGSGGLTGKGWGQGTQKALGFLPRSVAHNDFIFSVIAEEEGFVGSVIVLTLYTIILFSGIKIASQARDRLGRILAVGVVALLFSHVFINIGMNIRLMPVTGIPLPLLSYGGSSVLCSLIAIGILQNVHMYRRSY